MRPRWRALGIAGSLGCEQPAGCVRAVGGFAERYLSFAESKEIAVARAADESIRTIAARLGRSPGARWARGAFPSLNAGVMAHRPTDSGSESPGWVDQ